MMICQIFVRGNGFATHDVLLLFLIYHFNNNNSNNNRYEVKILIMDISNNIPGKAMM